MSVDMYAICPCGSGKKIKFCKCRDSVHQLDELLKMIEGGQVVPALDRMNAILESDPEAAWVLAIRGRLFMDLREYASLAENAERFIRLQPSNPLALTQRAAAKLFEGDLDAATESVLEALTESGQNVDSFVMDVASILAVALLQNGRYLTARVYATLGMVAAEYSGSSTALSVLQSINSSPMVNGYLKQVPEPKPRPDGVQWAERFDEASTLLRSNKVTLAESKFDSLRRTVPDEPAVLGGLLTCAIWRGDISAQVSLLQRLGDCESLSEAERVRYRATSVVVDPRMPEISVPTHMATIEVDQFDEINMAMAAANRFVDLPPDAAAQFRTSEDDVPPRAVYQIADREVPAGVDEGVPGVDLVPESLATVLCFGKQTDRAARIEVIEVRDANRDAVAQSLGEIDASLTPSWTDSASLPLVLLADPNVVALRIKAKPDEVERMQSDLFTTRAAETITSAPLPILKRRSLADCADDDAVKFERTVVVRVLEQYEVIQSRDVSVLEKIREVAGVEAPPMLTPSSDEVESIDSIDLARVDPSNLDLEALMYLLQRTQQVGVKSAGRQIAMEVLSRDVPDDEADAKVVAYMVAAQASGDTAESIRLINDAQTWAEKHGIDHPPIYLSQLNLTLASGDGEAFQRTLETITTRYRDNPEVMAQVESLLVRMGLIRPDGSTRNAPPGAGPAPGMAGPGMAGPGMAGPGPSGPAAGDSGASGGSGLWTPDGGSPPAGGGGGGKIILPGME